MQYDLGKKALLVTYPNKFSILEARSLAETAGYHVVGEEFQKNLTRSRFGVGKGKAETIKEAVAQRNADIILFDEVLKPSQQYNLARLCKVDVIDREKMILEIFTTHAVTNESRIQVKLAQLKYDIVRVKEKTRLAKMGEQPGFYGLGKYDADIHILDIKRRTSILLKKLKQEEKKRELHRIQRLVQDTPLIALTGYTSAGKTTLFNLLVEEKKDTSPNVFTTLTTYTRSLHIKEKKFLLTDTIGFISKLPPYMIQAFRSTLSELNYANLILLILDFSEDVQGIRKKLISSIKILSALQIPISKCILVLNKVDMVLNTEIEDKLSQLRSFVSINHMVPISASNNYNVQSLKNLILDESFSN